MYTVLLMFESTAAAMTTQPPVKKEPLEEVLTSSAYSTGMCLTVFDVYHS